MRMRTNDVMRSCRKLFCHRQDASYTGKTGRVKSYATLQQGNIPAGLFMHFFGRG